MGQWWRVLVSLMIVVAVIRHINTIDFNTIMTMLLNYN